MKRIVLITTAIILLIAFEGFSYTKQTYMVPMYDGIKLYTEVFFPDNLEENETLPVILQRTPYGLNAVHTQSFFLGLLNELTSKRRYILVAQEIRGTERSEGKFQNFSDDGWLGNKDGYYAVKWITEQKWCNGKVSMFGISASAQLQNQAILAETPNLVCGFSIFTFWNFYLDAIYPGGILLTPYLEFMINNFAKYDSEIGNWFLDNYLLNDAWDTFNFKLRKEKYNIPVFHVGGWYDSNQGPPAIETFYDINYFGGENAKGKQKLMIGPWSHERFGSRYIGQITFPPSAVVDFIKLRVDWYEYWMNDKKDNGMGEYPNISLYLMGPIDIEGYWNDWLYFNDWPFNDTDTIRFYLSNEGLLSKEKPEENEKSIIYNPNNPFNYNYAPYDSYPINISSIWNDPKIISFETPICEEAYDIFGNVNLEVYLSSYREDTDVIAQLVDIYPDGPKIWFSSGVLKTRYRDGFDRENFLIPFEIAKLNIDMRYTAYTIVPGHKLGIYITSSNSALFAINPNTSEPVNKSKDTLVAINTFHFGGDNATVLVLPIRKPGSVSVSESCHKNSVTVYPNPFSESTVINYELQTADRVKIDIFNSLGEKITTHVDEWQEAGRHNCELRMTDYVLSEGMYFYRIQIGDRIESGKLLLIK